MCAMRPSPNGFWLPVCIAKVIGIFDHRVASMPRLAFEGLELSDGKLSRSVLRGLGGSNAPRLPGLRHEVAYFDCSAKASSLCLNPASRRCDPMEACAQGASLTGMKPS